MLVVLLVNSLISGWCEQLRPSSPVAPGHSGGANRSRRWSFSSAVHKLDTKFRVCFVSLMIVCKCKKQNWEEILVHVLREQNTTGSSAHHTAGFGFQARRSRGHGKSLESDDKIESYQSNH